MTSTLAMNSASSVTSSSSAMYPIRCRSAMHPTKKMSGAPSARRMSVGCGGSDHSPMFKRPTRRPSLECDDSCCKDLQDDHSESDATHVTSNKQEEEQEQEQQQPVKQQRSSVSTAITAKLTLAESLVEKHSKQRPVGFPALSIADDCDLQSKPGEISFANEDDIETDIIVVGSSCGDHEDAASLKSTTSLQVALTEARVRTFMVDYYEDFDSIFQTTPADAKERRMECMSSFTKQYFTPDFTFIRPSGNPLDGPGFAKLMAQHIVVSSMKLVSIDSVQILNGGLSAIVVFTADQQFSFKGNPQSDRTIITAILNTTKEEGGIQIAHKHRSPGIPIPKTGRWD